MGLDLDLVKFNKAEFDQLAEDDPSLRSSGPNTVCYMDGRDVTTHLYYYRKNYEARDILFHLFKDGSSQCDFHRLTKEELLRGAKLANRLMSKKNENWREECLQVFRDNLNVIINETDFDKEVIAFSWIS